MGRQLIVDIGNSRTKVALFEGRQLQEVCIDPNAENPIWKDWDQAIIASVKKNLPEQLLQFSQQDKVQHFTYQSPLPIKNAYHSPQTLGVDRLAAAVGAWSLEPEHPCLIIDAGSCITYEFVNKHTYYGGAISPGLRMRLKSMHLLTDGLPDIAWNGSLPELIGTDTSSSMLSGAIRGACAEIEGLIATYQQKHPKIKVFLTGGDTSLFEKALKNGIFADPNLVLIGLNEILLYTPA